MYIGTQFAGSKFIDSLENCEETIEIDDYGFGNFKVKKENQYQSGLRYKINKNKEKATKTTKKWDILDLSLMCQERRKGCLNLFIYIYIVSLVCWMEQIESKICLKGLRSWEWMLLLLQIMGLCMVQLIFYKACKAEG